MKKSLILLTFLFLLINYSCKKETEISHSNESSNSIQKSQSIDNNFLILNPFDKNKDYIIEMYQDIEMFLANIENYTNYDDYMRDFEKLMSNYNNSPYPKLDINVLDDADKKIITNFIQKYMKDIENIGLTRASNQIEKTISLMSDYNIQQSLFSIVSQIKFTFYADENIPPIDRGPYYDRWKACMDDHFDNMNWVNWVEFSVNPPVYVGWVAASCAWSAR